MVCRGHLLYSVFILPSSDLYIRCFVIIKPDLLIVHKDQFIMNILTLLYEGFGMGELTVEEVPCTGWWGAGAVKPKRYCLF